MAKGIQDLNRPFNLVRLADETVLALSSIGRGGKESPELLKKGIELCDYLINLFKEIEISVPQMGQWSYHKVRDDKKVLQESGIDIEKVKKAMEWIKDLIENPSSHTAEEIKEIQEVLMAVTMPIWRNRTSEFRERKLKRGLIIHG